MATNANLPKQEGLLARSAPSAPASQQHHPSEQCSQLWAQLQELMQQRELAVSAREQHTAQYDQVDRLLVALAQHVQGLVAHEDATQQALGLQEQQTQAQQQAQQPEPTDQHAAALQVVQQLLQQAGSIFRPHSAQQTHPALPAQHAGNANNLAPVQLAAALSAARSSTGGVLLGAGNLQKTMVMQQAQHAGGDLARQQQQQQHEPRPGQQQQQQQQLMRDEFQALSRDMQAQLVHLQQLQATLESELQLARLFAQYMAADPAAAAAFQAWQDSQQHAGAAAGVLRAPSPPVPQPQGVFSNHHHQQQQQQQQDDGLHVQDQDSLQEQSQHRSRNSSPLPAAAVGVGMRSRSVSPRALTVTQLAAYRLSGGRNSKSRSCTPQPPQQQSHAGAQELAAAFPAAASTSPHKRPWSGVNGTGAAGGSRKRQRLDASQTGDSVQQQQRIDGLVAAGAAASEAAGAAAASNRAGVDGATGAQAAQGAADEAAAAMDRSSVPGPDAPPAAAAAAAAAGSKHMFRPTIPGRRPLANHSASDGSADAAAVTDAAAAATGDRGVQPAARHAKVFRTQNRYGGGRGGRGGRTQAAYGGAGYTAQQQHGGQQPEPGQQQEGQQGQGLSAQSLQQQEEPGQQEQQQQEAGQQGQPVEDDLDELYQQQQLVQYNGSSPVPSWQGEGAGADGCGPPETLYAAADGQIFYHQPGPEQQAQRGKGRKQHQHHQLQQQNWQQQQQAAAGKKAKKRKKKKMGGVNGEGNDDETAEDAADGDDRAADGSAAPDGLSNGHAPAAAAATAAAAVGGGGGDGGQFAPPGRSSNSSYQNGRRHQHHYQQHQQQKQGQPPPYPRQQQNQHHQHPPHHHWQQQQQQHKGSGPAGRSGMRMRGRGGDEQDASEQELQRMVAELKQQAAAVTAGGSDATASGS